jgi:sugar phosphate isomerase/epimerase
MAKLGVITDGISRDFEHALGVMSEVGLDYAELQFLWDKEVGDLDQGEIARVKSLVESHGVTVSCISRHNFAGLSVFDTEVGDPAFEGHMDKLKRCIEMAQLFGTDLVRIMSYRKEMILFGEDGADEWNESTGAWDKLLTLLGPPLRLAEAEGVTLIVETGNNAIITSGWLGRRLIDELGTKTLKVLWDPANSLYCNEPAYPDGYEALQGGYLGHVHMKDAVVDIPKAKLRQCEMGAGQMAPLFEPIAQNLKRDGYDGVISLESVYRPDGGTYEDGFRASVGRFKALFA